MQINWFCGNITSVYKVHKVHQVHKVRKVYKVMGNIREKLNNPTSQKLRGTSARLRVAVAMSGGVDSSVAAKILKDQGHDVAGIFFVNHKNTLKISKSEFSASARAGRDGLMSSKIPISELKKYPNLFDAHRVAEKLNIPLCVVDVSKKFDQEIIKYFLNEYKNLRTPNPCVVCNQKIKFGWLLDFAEKIGCDYLATGHYARIIKKSKIPCLPAGRKDQNDNSKLKNISNATYHLLKARDENKDQSYFLYRLNQDQLSKVIFPLGEYTKDEVRAMAMKWKLPVYQKKDSHEVCFIADNDIEKYLKDNLPARYFKPGEIVDTAGNIIGAHIGLVNYTIGQRRKINQKSKIKNQNYRSHSMAGLLSNDKLPLYVVGFDSRKNRLIVGEDSDVYRKEMVLEGMHFVNSKFKIHRSRLARAQTEISKLRNLTIKIRSQHQAAACSITKIQNTPLRSTSYEGQAKYKIQFERPQRAVTPGQSAVLCKNDEVIGGGIIS